MTCKFIMGMRYKLVSPPGVSFEHAPPANTNLDGVTIEIEDGIVEFTFEKPYESVEEARRVVSDIVEKWQVSHGLTYNGETLDFEYITDIIEDLCSDKQRTSGQDVTVGLNLLNEVATINSVNVQVQRGSYSLPDIAMTVTHEVKMLYERYCGYLQGRESLQSFGYFTLDHLETTASKAEENTKKRRAAARIYKIDFEDLKELGRLTSMGGPESARKAYKDGEYVELTDAERMWVKKLMPLLIKQVAYYHGNLDQDFEMITIESI